MLLASNFLALYIHVVYLILISLAGFRLCISESAYNQNISELLDGLMHGYDYHLRPNFGGPPTKILIDIEVRSMGPVSEIDMSYSMDCYFRQSWVDKRLAFKGTMSTLALSISMLERIWKPDTYFYNGKHSYLHMITTPNKFVRLHQDGRVLYSSRLTIRASCPMNLENFPMDKQKCPLEFGSFGYASKDVLYVWNPARSVVTAPDMKMSMFDLIGTPSGNQTETMRKGSFSVLLVSFHLQRHMGYFIIEVYAPCIMLVVLSWVSFWINREATADRVALGVTTVLTMTFLGLESRNDLPKVPYCTALDFYVAISFVFIFATIVEFAMVHYFTKIGSGEYYFPPDSSSEDSSGDEEHITIASPGPQTSNESSEKIISVYCMEGIQRKDSRDATGYHRRISDPSVSQSERRQRLSTNGRILGRLSLNKRSSFLLRRNLRSTAANHFQLNSVSKIDRISRVFFPVCFIMINIVYWLTYL
ncbi:gamma-aminobutyric acid receptor alpha-like [Centruroides sculpturatus]|uniref:gamma-aminobutyric acid receptor alpha-like n=1 Tax=Centruroides sculpturatus TaxID=218467 RepID=UPI000C6C9BD1|nr:gamma-aminobutyric acid receptor alpha-like [Centruroides sculpturatus]